MLVISKEYQTKFFVYKKMKHINFNSKEERYSEKEREM